MITPQISWVSAMPVSFRLRKSTHSSTKTTTRPISTARGASRMKISRNSVLTTLVPVTTIPGSSPVSASTRPGGGARFHFRSARNM